MLAVQQNYPMPESVDRDRWPLAVSESVAVAVGMVVVTKAVERRPLEGVDLMDLVLDRRGGSQTRPLG